MSPFFFSVSVRVSVFCCWMVDWVGRVGCVCWVGPALMLASSAPSSIGSSPLLLLLSLLGCTGPRGLMGGLGL